MPSKPRKIYLPALLSSLTWRLLGIDGHMGVMPTFLFWHFSPSTHLSTYLPTHTRWLLTVGSRHNSRYSKRKMQTSNSSDRVQWTWDMTPGFLLRSRHFAPATGWVGYFSPLRISLGQRPQCWSRFYSVLEVVCHTQWLITVEGQLSGPWSQTK